MAGAEKDVFPDVNILIHFPAFDGLDWLRICDAGSVVIRITQPVLKELNKIKDTGHTKAIRRRAATVQKRLKELLHAGPAAALARNVTVQFHPRSAIAKHHDGLDDGVSDDALISAILTFAETSSQTPFLMTDDSGLGLMVKAAEWKIDVIEPPDESRLPTEIDPDQKERDQLRKKVAQLEQSQPQLDLAFTADGQLLKTAPLVSDISADVHSRLAKLKERHPRLALSNPEPERQKMERLKVKDLFRQGASLKDALLSDFKTVEKYNARLEKFLCESERVLSYNAAVRQRMLRIEIQVNNSGFAPAKDVLVDMHFPDRLKPLAADDLRDVLKKMPAPPQNPAEVSMLSLALPRDYASQLPEIHFRSPDDPSLYIKETKSFNVQWHIPKLRQGHVSKIHPLFVLFDDKLFSFPITYTVVAENSHDISKGTLNVVVA